MSYSRAASGFTIVELLIVIVVIAILAAITVVGYNGVQRNAQISVAKSDLSSLHKAMQVLAVDNASYTASSAWNKVLHSSGLYDATADVPAGTKSFAICATNDRYAIGAGRPLPLLETDGAEAFYITSDRGIETLSWEAATPGATTLARYCAQILPGATYLAWSFGAGLRD